MGVRIGNGVLARWKCPCPNQYRIDQTTTPPTNLAFNQIPVPPECTVKETAERVRPVDGKRGEKSKRIYSETLGM